MNKKRSRRSDSSKSLGGTIPQSQVKCEVPQNQVDTSHSGSSKSLKDGKRVLEPCSGSKVKLKKHKENDEDERPVHRNDIKEIKNSIKELYEAVINIQELLLTKADVQEVSPKKEEKETPEKNELTCCFENEDIKNNDDTLFVKGFQTLRPRDEIKNALRNHFRTCGVTRVFVPVECKTGLSLGFAFIDVAEDGKEKALALNTSYLEGKKLEVMMAKQRDEFYGYTDFGGCKRCRTVLRAHWDSWLDPRKRHRHRQIIR